MTIPTIHLNGTSATDLLEAIEGAFRALHEAIRAVQVTAPNARDYYPQGPVAFATAATEHADRYQRLVSVKEELEAIYEAIAEQEEERKQKGAAR